MRHPAKFSDDILKAIDQYIEPNTLTLDPFAGTGRIHKLSEWSLGAKATVGVEIEPEWAAMHEDTIVGNALHLPFADKTFDNIATSPCYGNRFSDHHNAKDGSTRHSYTHDLRASTNDPTRHLHPDNAGTIKYGPAYQLFHRQAWREALRVLKPGGRFVLNISDHYKTIKGEQILQNVSGWHLTTLQQMGLSHYLVTQVSTTRLRFGANRKRVEWEWVICLVKP